MFFATFYIIANIFQSYELWLLYRCFFGKSTRGAGIEFLAFVLFFVVTMLLNVFIDITTVSYTHLDVNKRQAGRLAYGTSP